MCGEVAALRAENAALRARLATAQAQAQAAQAAQAEAQAEAPPPRGFAAEHALSRAQVERYSRQMVLPAIGAAGQAGVCSSRVCVVGLGGLGSPVALYLAAAGVGALTLVDADGVDASNLHRQVIHTEGGAAEGLNKAESAARAVARLNSSVRVACVRGRALRHNAAALAAAHDVVVDCSDNAATRYVLSDACCAGGEEDHARTPLVSGAAVGTDGQLSVYCHGQECPCYRCVHPKAPPRASCQSCSDAGVLGPVVGVIGAMQALEAVKLCAGVGTSLAGRLVLLDGLDMRLMTVRLRKRDAGCAACGQQATITRASMATYDYDSFAGPATEGEGSSVEASCALTPEERTGASELAAALAAPGGAAVLDVRSTEQHAMAALPGSTSIPFDALAERVAEAAALVPADGRLFVVCRRGNDSQRAVRLLRAAGVQGDVVDVRGGLAAFAREVPGGGFPAY